MWTEACARCSVRLIEKWSLEFRHKLCRKTVRLRTRSCVALNLHGGCMPVSMRGGTKLKVHSAFKLQGWGRGGSGRSVGRGVDLRKRRKFKT